MKPLAEVLVFIRLKAEFYLRVKTYKKKNIFYKLFQNGAPHYNTVYQCSVEIVTE
jgi:hypothetical protein